MAITGSQELPEFQVSLFTVLQVVPPSSLSPVIDLLISGRVIIPDDMDRAARINCYGRVVRFARGPSSVFESGSRSVPPSSLFSMIDYSALPGVSSDQTTWMAPPESTATAGLEDSLPSK